MSLMGTKWRTVVGITAGVIVKGNVGSILHTPGIVSDGPLAQTETERRLRWSLEGTENEEKSSPVLGLCKLGKGP